MTPVTHLYCLLLAISGKFLLGDAYDIESTDICDNYLLFASNMTHEDISRRVVGRKVPTILGHRFQYGIAMKSHCVHITSCVTPGSSAHRELMMAVNMQRSLSWKIIPCQGNQPVPAMANKQKTGKILYKYIKSPRSKDPS